MAEFEYYITVGKERLRCGYTTGTCAAAAARGAAELLLHGTVLDTLQLETPAGIVVPLQLLRYECGDGWAQCAVRKFSGDDPDVTNGILVFARVEFSETPGITIDGGLGVGRVTREGLDQPVGAAAINSVPRRMIEQQVRETLGQSDCECGLLVVISIPEGEALAQRTFNPKLGIEGGISVIGTSGIVKPMSEEALIESIRLEIRMRRAEGRTRLLLAPGNYGIDFAHDELGLDVEPAVQCSNFLGAALDEIAQEGFEQVLLVGHIGKLVKVAAGIFYTHSHTADARMETMAAHAACAGASQQVVQQIMACVTTDAALDVLDGAGLLAPVMEALIARIDTHVNGRTGVGTRVEVVMFTKGRGLLAQTDGAQAFAKSFR